MRHTGVVFFVGLLALSACKAYDPLYCDANTPCTDPERPFCDLAGDYPASEGVARTCIPEPDVGGDDDDDGSEDDSGDDGAVGQPCDETTCTDGVLDTCGADGIVESSEECALGCFADGKRCSVIVPSNGLTTQLDESILEPAVELPDGTTIDTDTGAIRSAQGDPIAVLSVTVPQPDGPTIRVFMASAWTIHDVKIRGSLPVAFVTTGEIEIAGILDASADGSTPGPGGRDCAEAGNGEPPEGGHWEFNRQGPSYPDRHFAWAGAGGGGFGSRGGDGGAALISVPGQGGAINGAATLVPIVGGCPGGSTKDSYRGAGGGAMQLASARRIRVQDGVGAIHVGGGGGMGAAIVPDEGDEETRQPSAGGGGSGGAVLLEAPAVYIEHRAALLAAGGGGGGGMALCAARNGNDATPDPSTPIGGICPAEGEYIPPPGGAGASAQSAQPGAEVQEDRGGCGAGGGGGHGRIRINTANGDYDSGSSAVVRGVLTTGSVGRR